MSEDEYNFEVLGLSRGRGDPDIYGYPGQDEHNLLCDCNLCQPDSKKYINKLTRKDKRNGRSAKRTKATS